MFRGAITALVTPFRGGKVDEEAYRRHIDWQIEQGIDGVVPCGTTGESATLTHEEHRHIIEVAIAVARGRVPVIAGTGSNNTAEAVELTRHAKKAGAAAALLITPYYNKPTQEGLFAHYKKVAEEAKFPFIVYNVPGRTGVNLLPETVARLRAIPEVVGIKEATGSLAQVSEILQLCGRDFTVLSGDDATVLPSLAVGARGVISVVSNVAPADMAGMIRAFERGDIAEARRLHYKLLPLTNSMFFETNPIPVKTALGMMGRIDPEVRLPLCAMGQAARAKLEAEMKAYGLAGGAV
jgi:4-hydroxy-tetrahydrodipicolinate synthase